MKTTSPLLSASWCTVNTLWWHNSFTFTCCLHTTRHANGNFKKTAASRHPASQRAAAGLQAASGFTQPATGGAEAAGGGGVSRAAAPPPARQNKRTDSAPLTPPPSDEAAGRRAVTVPPGVKAQDFLGGVSLCCSMRSIRAAESCFLCGHKAELLPLPSAADTLWCCQWCNAQLKGGESGFY